MKHNNLKKILVAIILLVIVVAVIVLVIKFTGNKNSNNIDNNNDNNNYIENDENIEVISKEDTTSVSDYVDEQGNALSDDEVSKLKNAISEAVKQFPTEKLGINEDINNARFIFNRGTTTISGEQYLTFSIYVLEGEKYRSRGMFAMSKNTEKLYKYNSEKSRYERIEK